MCSNFLIILFVKLKTTHFRHVRFTKKPGTVSWRSQPTYRLSLLADVKNGAQPEAKCCSKIYTDFKLCGRRVRESLLASFMTARKKKKKRCFSDLIQCVQISPCRAASHARAAASTWTDKKGKKKDHQIHPQWSVWIKHTPEASSCIRAVICLIRQNLELLHWQWITDWLSNNL